MNSGDRGVISENVPFLLNTVVRVPEFIAKVKKSNILRPETVDILLGKGLEEVFLAFTKRGPPAYNLLISCLRDSDNEEAANFLETNKSPYSTEVPEESYLMKSSPLGHALVVNFDFFDSKNKDKMRNGSHRDEENLVKLWETLGYVVTKKRNLKAKKLMQEVENFRDMKEHNDCDSCVVFIMSHGKSSKGHQGVRVECSDGIYVHSSEIIEKFRASKCRALAAKPKMFFFQACRGSSKDFRTTIPQQKGSQSGLDHVENGVNGVSVENGHEEAIGFDGPSLFREANYEDDKQEVVSWSSVGDTSDMLVVYPTHPGMVVYPTDPGKVSIRCGVLGAWFVQDICNVFEEHYKEWDLMRMLREVMRVMDRRYDIDYGSQLLHYENYNFNKLLYFKSSAQRVENKN